MTNAILDYVNEDFMKYDMAISSNNLIFMSFIIGISYMLHINYLKGVKYEKRNMKNNEVGKNNDRQWV